MTEVKPAWRPVRVLPKSRPIFWWQVLLGAIAVLNVALWALSVAGVLHAKAPRASDLYVDCQLQLVLSAVYVLGCAFRSVLPVYDIPRIVLVDSRLSSVIVGRSVATVAELCFAGQWALFLHRIALLTHSPFAAAVSLAIVPLVILAELSSWHAVVTTEQRGHILENSIWGLAAVLLVASVLVIGPGTFADLGPLMILWSVGGAAYAAFIFFFDVPMYWTRWRADQVNGRCYLSLAAGIVDACNRRVISHRWDDWKDEMLWMSLYFSFGVWSSISLVFASVALVSP